MTGYIALIRKDADSDFGVEFPDFPGCVTAGSTLDEARQMADEALQFHIAGMVEDGEDVPTPSSLDEIIASLADRNAVAALIDVEPPSKAVRINISIQEDLLARADRLAEQRGMTRSGMIAAALKQTLQQNAKENMVGATGFEPATP